MRIGKLTLLVAAMLLSLLSYGLAATDFPNKEIRIIIPFSAGGQSDLTARKLAEVIQKHNLLPKTVLVVNMPGANTMNGLNTIKSAKPDGYTIMLHHTDMIPQNLFKAISASWHDFDMVCQVMQFPFVISTKGDAPWNKASEFIADAKKNPGKFNIAAPAPGGATYLSGIIFLKAAGIDKDVKVRPAEGGNDAATALMSGAATIRVAGQSDSARFVKGGQEKVLFVLSNEKSAAFPNAEILPDINGPKASGIPMSSGIWAPKGTPDEIKNLLADAFKKAIDTPEFQEFMKVQIVNPYFLPRDDWKKVFDNFETTYREIIKDIKL